jgi:SAM-dependent methyltransferase
MNEQADWWQGFFSGPVLDFVRHSRDQEQTLADAHFLERALELPPGSRLLDVPCGAGRLALEMARRGYSVTGVDLCQELLEYARTQADTEGLDCAWQRGDMRHLAGLGQFDGAYCFWNSFGYFDDAGNAQFLRAVSQALKPGAPLVMDTPLLETRLPEMAAQERDWWQVGNLLALEERRFDHTTGRVESDWTFIQGGQLETRHLSLRLYTYRELVALLEQAGFSRHEAYGSLDWEPFELGAPWLYLIAYRRPDGGNPG